MFAAYAAGFLAIIWYFTGIWYLITLLFSALFWVILIGGFVVAVVYSKCLFGEPAPPTVEEGWWGEGPRERDTNIEIREFKVRRPSFNLKLLYIQLPLLNISAITRQL